MRGNHPHGLEMLMQKKSLDAIASEQLDAARRASSRRAATTVFGGHEYAMRQTIMALCEGAQLSEHESPGEATIVVLGGRVELRADSDAWQGRRGDLLIVPDRRHSLVALEDATILLTAVPRAHAIESSSLSS